jgi:gliding motility-associated-like protein
MKKNSKTYLFLAYLLIITTSLFSQVDNDDCITSIFIPNVDNYCSAPFEFSNENATMSSNPRPGCWPQDTEDSDVWFSFRPKNLAALIQVTGLTPSKVGTLNNPSVAIYSGNCNSLTELACGSVLFEENNIELTLSDLNIGALYYIRIDGRAKQVGKFKLCINTFAPTRTPEADCSRGVVLCDKEEIVVNDLVGIGREQNEVDPRSCLRAESASVWYKWTCKDAGTLTFNITPNNKQDDIDFILYQLPNGLNDCTNKRTVRCMASGESIGNDPALNSPCFGPTGCNPGREKDNFLSPLDMKVGESYVLLINNFNESGNGFSIKFGGTGTFLGPLADFKASTLDRFECDKSVTFLNDSKSTTDSIISYKWNFGDGSAPSVFVGKNPGDVVYSSFGDKTTALTVTSLRGCTVTKIIDYFINPCCKDTTTLSVSATAKDVLCNNLKTGVIDANPIGGAGGYTYSLDSITFQPVTRFNKLGIGNYSVYIRDSKGCINKTNVKIDQPTPIIVDAGQDFEILLGESAVLNGSYSGGTGFKGSKWIADAIINSPELFRTEITPVRTTPFVLSVIDNNGCEGRDTLQVRVRVEREIFAPNIIKGSITNGNNFFSISGGISIEKINELKVYDRWGNLVYNGKSLEINTDNTGWNGLFNGEKLLSGVYTWVAKILYKDNEEFTYSGDVTLIY